jgi:Protein of unknown function (DUF1566)
MVTDRLTWQRAVDPQSYDWSDAQAYCAGLTLAGGGWRVPSVKELMTLLDFGVLQSPYVDTTAFPSTPSDYFWSSSLVAGYPSGGLTVNFLGGNAYDNDGVSSALRVRCVR